MMVVVPPFGTGKSSLLHAGVLPALAVGCAARVAALATGGGVRRRVDAPKRVKVGMLTASGIYAHADERLPARCGRLAASL